MFNKTHSIHNQEKSKTARRNTNVRDAQTKILGIHHCHVIPVEAPQLSDQDLHAYLKYKIRSFYPGDVKDTHYDYVKNGSEKGDFLLYIYGDNDSPDFVKQPHFHLLQYLLNRKPSRTQVLFSLIQYDGVWEVYEQHNQKITAAAGFDTIQDAGEFVEHRLENDECKFLVNIYSSQTVDIYTLSKVTTIRNNTTVFPLSDLTSQKLSGPGKKPLFLPKRFVNLKRRYFLLALCAVLIGFAAIVVHTEKDIAAQQKQLDEDIRLYMSVESKVKKALDEQQQYKELSSSLEQLTADWNPSFYIFLGDLTSTLGRDARIFSVTYKNDRFVIQCRGRNPLGLIERLQSTGKFLNLTHSMIVPEADTSLELFQIEGVYSDK